ncbi:selina-4(15),7(11)-diene synthase [Streptomyces sp. NPDC048644]|uniref:selina-4(15),7(11)-diene synthase n=1 Tax=Streptomyces sp. NPDC048644 TaxID=3365582 RepID=UPI003710DF9E
MIAVEALRVPPTYAPIPAAIHPQHEAIEARTTAWAHRLDIGSPELRSRLVTHSIGTFASRILPEGREEVVGLLADFVLWLFAVDDGYCEEGELGRRPGDLIAATHRLLRIAQLPDAPMLTDDPLARGLRDLQSRMTLYGTPAQVARWIDALREYVFSVSWEAHYRVDGRVPEVNDYTLMRLYNGATTVVMPLLEMGYGYELQPHERDDALVRAAADMASFIIVWDNDIFSHHKESRSDDAYYLNILRVLQDEEGLSPQQALTCAIGQRDRVMTLFLRLRTHLEQQASPQLRQYLHSLSAYIRGAQDWGITSLRYTTPDDPAGLPTTLSDSPSDSSPEPLDIPVIAPWWNLLPDPAPHRAALAPERAALTV